MKSHFDNSTFTIPTDAAGHVEGFAGGESVVPAELWLRFYGAEVHTYFFGVGGGGLAHQVQVVAGHYGFVGGAVGVVVRKHEKRHRNQSCAKQILRFIYLVFIGLCV